MAINIVKLENGNVALYDNGTGDFLRSLSADYVELECNVNGNVKLIQNNGNVEFFTPALVANTQVLPAAAVPFAGTCADLAELLATDFFFELTGGGGIDFKYWKGNYQNFFETQGPVTSSALTWAPNNLAAYPIEIKEDVTIVDIRVAFATSVAGNSVFGVYDTLNGLPQNLLFQSTPFDNSISGAMLIDTLPSPISIKKGLYYVAYSTSSAPSIFSRAYTCVVNAFGANNSIATSGVYRSGGYTYVGSLPSTFGGPVLATIGTNVPNVLFTIS